MPDGRLGKALLAAATDIDLYTVPAGKVATANINLCNTGAASATVRIAIRSGALGAAPVGADYVEYDHVLSPGAVIERTGFALSAGEIITVRSDVTGVAARAHGFERAA